MKVTFQDKNCRELCESSVLAQRKLGTQAAKKLHRRLSDLLAAATITELVAGRPHPLTEDRKGQFALDLVHPQRLIFQPDHDPVPLTDDGGIDWGQVTQVQIICIVDYHD